MNIPYTSIVIKFQPSIVTNQIARIPSMGNYYMKIQAPMHSIPALGQALGEESIIPIPADGLLKLQLIPSYTFREKGSYFVKYYKKGNYIDHFREERWVVPYNPIQQQISFEYNSSIVNNVLQLQQPIYAVTSVEPNLPYTVSYDSLIWTQATPESGSRVKVIYQPGVNLDTLISLGNKHYNPETAAFGANYSPYNNYNYIY